MSQKPRVRIPWLTGFSGSRDPRVDYTTARDTTKTETEGDRKILCLLSSFCSPGSHQGFSLNQNMSQLTVDAWICGFQGSTEQEKEEEQVLGKTGAGLKNSQNPKYLYLYPDGWMDARMHRQVDFTHFLQCPLMLHQQQRKFFLAQVYYLNEHLITQRIGSLHTSNYFHYSTVVQFPK